MYAIQTQSQSLVLQSPTHRAEIYLHGGLLNQFAIQQSNDTWHNAIDAFTSPDDARANLINGFRSAKLSPYACRLRHGEYQFAGKRYRCDKHRLGNHAIHGLMYDADFVLEQSHADADSAWALLRADFTPDENAFPFAYQIQIQYKLNQHGLSIATQIINTGTQAMPLVDGWHPYFTLGGKVNDWTLHINTTQMLEFDADLLPTGKLLADTRFTNGATLNDTTLDNCFVLDSAQKAACTLSNNAFKLSIFADANYPYLQAYIPPERTSIALENLSGAPDAFNNGMGLITLHAGKSRTFVTCYVLEQA